MRFRTRVRVRRGAAIKKLLKIFLFIFSIYFTIKIFLKNTLLWPWFTKQRKKKARNSKQNTHTHTKKKKTHKKSNKYSELNQEMIDLGCLGLIQSRFRLFRHDSRPFWLLVDMIQFWPNRPSLARIPKKKKKKKPQMQHQRSGSSVGGRTLCWTPVRHPPNSIGASYLETTILAS